MARFREADSVVIRFRATGEPNDRATPAMVASRDSVAAPVLGLAPETEFAMRIVASNSCGTTEGPTLAIRTGALPADLPVYAAGGPDPSPGYVAFAAGSYGLVIDNTGRVVWYNRFEGGPGLNFQPQRTGHFVARPPSSDPLAPWIELDPLGNVTRTLGCLRGLAPRFHDLLIQADGSYWIMCDETRAMDLTASGGVANAQVTGTVVQHVSVQGMLLFEWSPFGHLAVTDLPAVDRSGANVNWTHGNALDLDLDGNLLVSFRSLSEIVKISTQTGDVVWRLGGSQNQFTFEDTPMPAFLRQHGVRVTGPGTISLLDNLGDPAGSRAERYVLDEVRRTARLVGSYSAEPSVTAQVGGTTQALTGGRTLVSFGSGGSVEEYDATGQMVWRIMGSPGYVFRAQRVQSLYTPGLDAR